MTVPRPRTALLCVSAAALAVFPRVAAADSAAPPAPPSQAGSPVERVPVAVLWMGEPSSPGGRAARTVAAIHDALARAKTARPIDSSEDRKVLLEGGSAGRAQLLAREGEAAFGALRFADAAQQLESAEELLLTDVPLAVTRAQLGGIERRLLVCYHQLGRAADAARAATRLGWVGGDPGDVSALVAQYRRSADNRPPVSVTARPPGAAVYRDLQAVGTIPVDVAGGDPAIDVLDVEKEGYRRGHLPLGSEPANLALIKEDRLGALVDDIRSRAPDAPLAAVTMLGERVGARRVLVLLPDGPKEVLARWLDVEHGGWAVPSVRLEDGDPATAVKLARYVSPAELPRVPPRPKSAASTSSAWRKWYTWTAAGAVIALIGTLFIVQANTSDQVTVRATH